MVYGLWTVVFTGAASAQPVSLKEILSSSAKFDGEIVEVEGEVIGDLIKDKDGAWINILSENNNIGIFSSDSRLDKAINFWGSYKENGDIVKIRGRFYNRCRRHQERDIHAESITVVKKGSFRNDSVAPYKIRLAVISFIICLTTAVVYFIKIGCKKK